MQPSSATRIQVCASLQTLQAPVHPEREEKPWLEHMEGLTRLEKQVPLSAYQPAGQCHQKGFIDKDRNVTSEYSVQNSATDNGRYGKKDQNPQPAAHIHERQPPVLFKICGQYSKT